MKKNIILFVIIFLSLFTVIVNAQSIWFLNPTNGEILTGTGSQTTVYMQLNFNYNLSGDPNLYDHYIKLFRSPYSTQQSLSGESPREIAIRNCPLPSPIETPPLKIS